MIQPVAVPACLQQIATPPKQLYKDGASLDDLLSRPRVAIVGSRKVSAYGREVTMRIAGELAARGIVIVSGLALGVDALAHRAALQAGGLTIAVLPSSLQKIYPATHAGLAREIIANGGALVSEYAATPDMFASNFIARNRLIAGLSQVTLITEAAEKSGSLHTARFALEQGRDVAAVPGSIFSSTSVGTNNLLKVGATPVTSYADVLHLLKLKDTLVAATVKGSTPAEQAIIDLLASGVRDTEVLLAQSGLDITTFNQALTMLEIVGAVQPLGGGQWGLR